jgi:hypothetical protein
MVHQYSMILKYNIRYITDENWKIYVSIKALIIIATTISKVALY